MPALRTSRRHLPALALPLALLSCSLVAACGAHSSLPQDSSTGEPVAVALFVADGVGCVEEPPVDTAAEVLTPQDGGEGIAVVDLLFAKECTNLGGDYVLGRALDGSRDFWLGGHGCEIFDNPMPLGLVFGVVRYSQTAAIFQISPDVCVGFPDQPPGAQTDAATRAIAVFETLEEAESFAGSLGSGTK